MALVESRDAGVGGVCIHTGTIPSKAIREAVLHLTGIRERSVYGEGYSVKQDITMSDLLVRCGHVVRAEVDVIRNQMARNGVAMFFGTASFVDPHTVRLDRDGGVGTPGSDGGGTNFTHETIELRGANVLIAVGTEPARPANVPFAKTRVIDAPNVTHLRYRVDGQR